MHRRTLIAGGIAALAAPRAIGSTPPPSPEWRRFGLVTRIDAPRAARAPGQAWVPVPTLEASWTRPEDPVWDSNADQVDLVELRPGLRVLHARWSDDTAPMVLTTRSAVETRGRALEPGGKGAEPFLSPEARAHNLAATDLIPTDGIVRETALAITRQSHGDLQKARAIYDWVVENSARNPETRGCGLGDVATMLHSGDLTGKCADLNALYVGLARASGLPARDLYGIRVAPSEAGFSSLGASSADVTGAQHCRAEVHIAGTGWMPVDPADVRKVMLQEGAGDLPLDHPTTVAAREMLFGRVEGNWVAYNDDHDVVLPGSDGVPLPFLMYPEVEVGGRRRDPLSPSDVAYTIRAEAS